MCQSGSLPDTEGWGQQPVQPVQLTRTHRILVGVVVGGALVIAAIGFAGSYAAVRDLAERKGFGAFSPFFPIGIDAGIVVLLALDLLLTWIRIPFPLLRQTAWLLTAATIAFNGAAAWPDPLGVGMHAVIPVLFVVAVEAARHAVGRIADITADKHMEGVRISRWLLAFPSTFRLWRRMKLWELRSYDEVIRMEQDRLVYEARLRARYGRNWRRRAPVESTMPLKLARYGIPLTETGPSGLEAAGLAPLPSSAPVRTAQPVSAPDPSPAPSPQVPHPELTAPAWESGPAPEPSDDRLGADRYDGPGQGEPAQAGPGTPGVHGISGMSEPVPEHQQAAAQPDRMAEPQDSDPSRVTVPVGPNRRRSLGTAGAPVPHQREAEPGPGPEPEPEPVVDDTPVGIPDDVPFEEFYYTAYRQYAASQGDFPTARQLSRMLHDAHGVTRADGSLLSEAYLLPHIREFRTRYTTDMGMTG